MRISDWSSDVCSSDLGKHQSRTARADRRARARGAETHPPGPPRQPDRLAQPGCHARAPGRGDRAHGRRAGHRLRRVRSEEHTSELQSLMRISYAVFCLKKKKTRKESNEEENN